MSEQKLFKSTSQIREDYQGYFEKQGHARVRSSSLIPHNDPTLLFTAAGMVQFKDCFLGADKRDYSRAVTVQKCLRAGGKHNDLENVGFTARHNTFFEMLGNFSFGDYFKKDAIHFTWEFVTKVLGLPKDRLRVSVYETDDESAEIWHKQEGLPLDRIVRFKEDNFWSAGDTGPCGPCTEIFWDQGKEVDGDRWLEFWNNVFMQFDRSADGKLNPLPKPAVDTGMGLERIASILQGVPSNYDIDLFQSLLKNTQAIASERAKRKIIYHAGKNDLDSAGIRVICDHLRATSFLIADGVLPSNEGRGYVLRRILRRAVRFAQRLGVSTPMLADLYPSLVEGMGQAYPELHTRKSHVQEILKLEEEKFLETLDHGLHLLEESFSKLGSSKNLPAEVAFKLYDTFGFPLDLTALIAREKSLTVDEVGFHKLMETAQERSRASWKGSGDHALPSQVKEWKSQGITNQFVGYEKLEADSKIKAHFQSANGHWLSMDPCPFYAEGGGQVSDTGEIVFDGKSYPVLDVQKAGDTSIAVFLKDLPSSIKIGQVVKAKVNLQIRSATQANHTATHLLHSALRKTLGEHVEQAGSLVTTEKLRFDFSHPKPIGAAEIQKIESWVNHVIGLGVKTQTEVTTYDDAVSKGAMALFGEKYGDKVRMLKVDNHSTELCGGTHVANTSEIRFFKIISESAVAAGTRRIEALTSEHALDWYRKRAQILESIAVNLKTPPENLEERVERMQAYARDLEKEIEKLKGKLASGSSTDSVVKAKLKGHECEIHLLDGADVGLLRQKADNVRKQKSKIVHVLYSHPLILITVDQNEIPSLHAGNLLKELATSLGGRGGGQGQTAQGQLTNVVSPEDLKKFLESQK